MRLLIHSVPPWAPSGYGTQCAQLARGLRDAGHEVAVSAFGGFIREEEWEGIQILNCGATKHGVGVTRLNYHRWNADAMITVCDFWVLDPAEWSDMNVASWVPVDTHGLSELDQIKLARTEACAKFVPVAMSKHGAAQFAEYGWESPVIPHMIRPEMKPGDRLEWRRANDISEDAFVIGMVAVNQGNPDRKAFDTTMCAFQAFEERHPGSLLYIHALPQHLEGLDLYRMIRSLGLSKKVGFPDKGKRMLDLISDEEMAQMHRGVNVLSAASRGEGFGVPVIESFACGTPVVGSRCAAVQHLVPARVGWLCDVQPQWCNLHASWWHTPLISSLLGCYEKAWQRAESMRNACASEGLNYQAKRIIPLWEKALANL